MHANEQLMYIHVHETAEYLDFQQFAYESGKMVFWGAGFFSALGIYRKMVIYR